MTLWMVLIAMNHVGCTSRISSDQRQKAGWWRPPISIKCRGFISVMLALPAASSKPPCQPITTCPNQFTVDLRHYFSIVLPPPLVRSLPLSSSLSKYCYIHFCFYFMIFSCINITANVMHCWDTFNALQKTRFQFPMSQIDPFDGLYRFELAAINIVGFLLSLLAIIESTQRQRYLGFWG